MDVVSEVSAGLPSTPRITFSGPLDSLVHASLADDLVAVLRECLANTVRHADARSVEIGVGIADGLVTLTVEDDGRGIPDGAPLSGLANLAERAHLRGGAFTIAARSLGGTRVEWSVTAMDGSESGAS